MGTKSMAMNCSILVSYLSEKSIFWKYSTTNNTGEKKLSFDQETYLIKKRKKKGINKYD